MAYEDTYIVEVGNPVVGGTIKNPKPDREYIFTGPNRFTPNVPMSIPYRFDEVTRAFGHKTYVDMLTDPCVYSQYLSLKLSIISGAIRVMPRVRPEGYRAGQAYKPRDGVTLAPQEQTSLDVASFCEREMCRPKHSFKSFLLKGLDMMVFGNKLAEMTREEVQFGPDKGKLGLASVKVKPYWSWQFVVDSTMEPVGILTWVPPGLPGRQQSGYAVIPIDKFVLFSWLPEDNDPRGTSAFRSVYDWWNLKRQAMPFYYQHLRRFGSPSLDMEMSPDDTMERWPLDPATGLEITTGGKVTPETRMTQALMAYANNSVIVHPAGSKLTAIEPGGKGESFLAAFDLFDRQICLGIGLQTRASLEAKNGSKADSETAQDTRGLVTAHAREELGEIVARQLFYESIRLNFGEDIAEEFTPECVVGATEQQDQAAMITALSSAGFVIGPSQLPEIDTMLGLPERDQEADDARAQEQMQKQADMAAQVKTAVSPGQSSGGNSGSSGGGRAPAGGQKASPASGGKPKPKGSD